MPKRFALLHADAIAVPSSPDYQGWSRVVTHPFVTLLQISTEGVLRVFGIRSSGSTAVTDEEINALVAEGAQQGVIDPAERQIVAEVFKIAVAFTRDHDEQARHRLARRERFRQGSASQDRGYRLQPLLGLRWRARQLPGLCSHADDRGPAARRSAAGSRVDGSRAAPGESGAQDARLVGRSRRARPHIALVIDEYGTTLGVVTPADVLETIAGDLADDVAAPAQVVRREDDSWLVDAQIELQDLQRALKAEALRQDEGSGRSRASSWNNFREFRS